jgi:uncharacterized protein (TIGR02246 family)
MTRNAYGLAAGGLLAALVASLTMQVRSADDGPSAKQPPAEVLAGSERASDEAAVRAAMANFIKAVEKGDAKAVAESWTPEGEYVSDDGTVIHGRVAIEAAYAKAFAKKKNTKVEITTESIRFPSRDTALEEGYAKSFKGDAERATSSHYSVLHVREDGHWRMALLRESPPLGDSLRDLDWLIGTWEAKTEEARIRTTYEWDAKKNSIRCHIAIEAPGRNSTGSQIILEDPRTGQTRSWLFDDDGGFGDATWTRDGKRWLIAASGVQTDGGELTATNILTPVNKDSFVWQSTERTLDGEALPNIPPVKVTRVK